jgi:predicted nucleic acid-binding protein
MKIFLDTSVIVPALVEQHADHSRCFLLLDRIHSGKDEGLLAAHSLAETYAILTKLPPPFRHSPAEALLSIQENFINHFQLIALTSSEYASVVKESASAGVQGGTIYDALLLKCAAKETLGKIYTLNLRHFRSVATPNLVSLITSP